MQLTQRELWTALHGMIFGAGFLLAFTGGFVLLWSLRSRWCTTEGSDQALRQIRLCTWAMAILSWITVISGTYVIYPWYRARPPANIAPSALANYPRSLLLSKPETADWHEFGMEWKEHVAWFAPILATAVAFIVTRNGRQILESNALRRMVLFIFTVAFFSAAVAGLLGAFINKAAPTH